MTTTYKVSSVDVPTECDWIYRRKFSLLNPIFAYTDSERKIGYKQSRKLILQFPEYIVLLNEEMVYNTQW